MQQSRTDIIEKLAKELKPVQVLAPYWHLGFSVLVPMVVVSLATAFLTSMMFSDFGFSVDRLANSKFIFEQILLFFVALSGVMVTLALSRPGVEVKVMQRICIGALVVWTVLGMSVLDSFLMPQFNVNLALFGYKCLVVSGLSGMPVGIILFKLINKGVVLNTPLNLFFLAISAMAMGCFALQFFCPIVPGSIKLIWHVLPIYVFSYLSFYLLPRTLFS
ncbi:MAG: NrsF family protein [Bdellovibrionales bacterium]